MQLYLKEKYVQHLLRIYFRPVGTTNLEKRPDLARKGGSSKSGCRLRLRQDARCQYGEVGSTNCPLHICELGTEGFEDLRPETQASRCSATAYKTWDHLDTKMCLRC